MFDPQLVSFTLDAPVVIIGTVQQLDASTEPSTPSTSARPLFVVSVDQQLFGELPVSQLTLDPQGHTLPAVNESDVFFVQPQIYGVGVVAEELHRVTPGTFPGVATDVPQIRKIAADRDLYDALVAAQRVVIAEVQSVASHPAGFDGSEHDPMWTDSTVGIRCVLNGPAGTGATVRFAASDDVAWYQSPKLITGEQSVMLLHSVTSGFGGGTYGPNDVYAGDVVAAARDVRPLSDTQHVVDLLACPPTL